MIAAGYNTRLAAFEDLVPALLKGYENYGNHVSNKDSLYTQLAEPISILKAGIIQLPKIPLQQRWL